jgi:hypothetical protein
MTRFARLIYVMIGLTLLSTSALVGTAQAETPFPTIHEPSDESLKCIQPEDEMRRNHMNYILHERDETMHEGVRNEPGSLAACIDCHVEPNENGEIAGIDSDEHFCSSCHTYASVQIDCFQCHADRPQKFIDRATSTKTDKSASLTQQLQETLAGHNNSSEGVNQ